jgi:hypothetical protein
LVIKKQHSFHSNETQSHILFPPIQCFGFHAKQQVRKRISTHIIQLLLCIPFLMVSGSLSGQDPLFSAMLTSSKVVQNSTFEITFELRNASGEGFRPPAFENFKVVGGPSIGSSTMIVNGQVSRSQSWTYTLLATTPGRFTIGSANVIAGRRQLASRPVTVEVLSTKDIGRSPNSPDGETVILIAELSPGNYYPGQQIVLQYKLLFRENVQSVNTISEDDYADFYVQPFNMLSPQADYETINGQQYASRVIKSIALYAHQSGTYTIDPLIIGVGINVPSPGNQGFFTMRRLRNVQVASQPKTIEVLPLPSPAPEGYSGAVGQYTISAVSGPTHITTDDDFAMRVEIKGNGDSRRWDPPRLDTSGIFELYDPRIVQENLTESEGMIMHLRTIDYLMIPQQPGEYTVSLPFTYFDPSTSSYKTIHTDTFRLQVLRGNNLERRTRQDTTAMMPRELGKVSLRKINDQFWTSPLHISLFGLSLIGVFYGLVIMAKRKREADIPASEKRRSAAARNARNELDRLANEPEIAEKTFFERATAIYYTFLEQKFNIPPADLDAEHVAATLSKAGIPDDIRDKAVAFFTQCLIVRYGGVPGGFTREEMTAEIRQMIDLLGS